MACEIWNEGILRILKAVGMKFMRRPAGYSLLDRRKNEDVTEELKIHPAEET
jgi:hypothetical protein